LQPVARRIVFTHFRRRNYISTVGKLVKIELYKLFHSKLIYFVLIGIIVFLTVINIQTKIAENRDRDANAKFNQAIIQEYKDHLQDAEQRIQELTIKSSLRPLEKIELDDTKLRLIELQKQGEPIIRIRVNLLQSLTTVFISDFGVYFILPAISLLVIIHSCDAVVRLCKLDTMLKGG